jgi:GDPmannose 4,6-dehydratase
MQKKLYIGNLYAKRDWGHAKEYVDAMWRILQLKKPDDFVIATGTQYTVKDFINIVAKELSIKIKWSGKGLNEKAYNDKGVSIIECDPSYFRPLEVDTLLGDYSKAKKILGWKPKINIKQLAKEMVENELKELRLSSDYKKY